MTPLVLLLAAGCVNSFTLEENKGDTGPRDADADGYTTRIDCDDRDAEVNPGAVERCNGVDDDCDALVDDADPDLVGAPTWHPDTDGDSFGDPDVDLVTCAAPYGWVADGTDCEDGDAAVSPTAPEVCDGLDNDCDTRVDDDDPDRVGGEEWHVDADGDRWGGDELVFACELPRGCRPEGGDCDDADPAINPDAVEVCNEVDDDCDALVDDADPDVTGRTWYADRDTDGYGNADDRAEACLAPAGYGADATDCDDADDAVHPAASEVCNGVDDDCDTLVDGRDPDCGDLPTWYADTDGDGFGDPATARDSCGERSGWVADGTDCDDTRATVSPDATEVCNGRDDDCDGLVDDADPDVPEACPASGDDGSVCSSLIGSDLGTVPSWTGACDETAGFQSYGGHCYYAETSGIFSWRDARATCVAAGGYLVVATDALESSFVYGIGGRHYAGACDNDREGTWVWITGEAFAWEDFGAGEPNDMGGEDCLEITTASGGWNDIACAYNTFGQRFVCEFE